MTYVTGSGTAYTGKWRSNGLAFYLADVSGGGAGTVVAPVTATVTTKGCQ